MVWNNVLNGLLSLQKHFWTENLVQLGAFRRFTCLMLYTF